MKFITEEQKRRNRAAVAVVDKPEEVVTAKDLKQELGGTFEQRMREERTIVLTMKHGERPDVLFTGFWNGKLVSNAMNAISRGYRQRKHKLVRNNAHVKNVTKGG